MLDLKAVKKNLNVLNLLLIGGGALVYAGLIAPLMDLNVGVKIPVPRDTALSAATRPADAPIPSPAEFMVIAEKNLFHPDRIVPVDASAAQAEQRPDLILSGTLISDDVRVAYIVEKKGGKTGGNYLTGTQGLNQDAQMAGRDKSQRAIRLGESLGGYVVKAIEAESIALAKGDDRIVFKLQRGNGRDRATAQRAGYAAPNGAASLNRHGYPTRPAAAGAVPVQAGRPEPGGTPAQTATPGIGAQSQAPPAGISSQPQGTDQTGTRPPLIRRRHLFQGNGS